MTELLRLEDLERATADFFSRHCHQGCLGPPPTRSNWDHFLKGSVPNHEHAGCYATFIGSGLDYVGLGASRGGGLYKDHGISRRLLQHVIRADRTKGSGYSALRPAWEATSAIWTIGLQQAPYLAPALESFLIRTLMPPRNKRV